MKNYSEDASRQYHIQVAKGEVDKQEIEEEKIKLFEERR